MRVSRVHERMSSPRVHVVLSSYVCFRGWDPYTETIHFVGAEGCAHRCWCQGFVMRQFEKCHGLVSLNPCLHLQRL